VLFSYYLGLVGIKSSRDRVIDGIRRRHPQRFEQNETGSNYRLIYRAISVSESVIKIGRLLGLCLGILKIRHASMVFCTL
jgi:hypothetical protein